jgi:hypothetical protein
MTTELEIEYVAKAICRVQFGDEATHGAARCCQLGGLDGCCLDSIREAAQAAIEALRQAERRQLQNRPIDMTIGQCIHSVPLSETCPACVYDHLR